MSGPYGPSLPAVPAWVRVPGFDGFGKIVDDEDDECNPVNFFDGIDRTHVRSMRNRKIPFSGGLADIAVATASIFDEVSGDYSAQKPVKLNRLGYIYE